MTGSLEGLPPMDHLPRWRTIVLINWVVVQVFVFVFIYPTISSGSGHWFNLSLAIVLELAAIWTTVSYWCVVVLLALAEDATSSRHDWLTMGSWLVRQIHDTVDSLLSD